MSEITVIVIALIIALSFILPFFFKHRYEFLIEAVKYDTFNKRMAFNSIKYFFLPASSIGGLVIAYFGIGHWAISFLPLLALAIVVGGITYTLTHDKRPSEQDKSKLENSISQLFSFESEQQNNVVEELTLIAENLKYTAQNYFELALSSIGLRKYERADIYLDFSISNFLKLKNKTFQLKECYFQKGIVLNNLNKNMNSIDYFKKVLEIEKNNYMALNNIGVIYNQNGDIEQSLKYFLRCHLDNPDNPFFATNLAHIYHYKENYDEELRILNEVLSKHPNYIYALINKGYLLNVIKRYAEAIDCFNIALSFQPNNPLILVNISICLARLNDYKRAYIMITKALELNPNDSGALLTKSSVCMYLNLVDEGRKAINLAIKLKPNDSDIWNSAGFYWMAYNNFEKSVDAFNKSIQLNPQNAKAWDNRQNYYIWA